MTTTTDFDTLIKEIECLMCFNISSNCRICVYCSAILCSSCLENWHNQRNVCPKCLKFVDEKDFVQCRFASKMIDFLDSPRFAKCEKHSRDSARLNCLTCEKFVCIDCVLVDGQHVQHNIRFMDETFRDILALNHKYLTFFRRRIDENEENRRTIETATELLLEEHGEELVHVNGKPSATDIFIKKTQDLLNEFQIKNETYRQNIDNDRLVVNLVEQRLSRSRNQLDQEEILQLFQQRISTG